MAGRRGRRQRQPAAAGPPPPWDTLPSELLVAALGHLSAVERHRAAVCVSKQWHDACYAPALFRQLSIGCGYWDRDSWSVPRLESLCSWLVRRRPAQHADSVTLQLFLPTSERHEEPAEELSEVGQQERECLAACMAAISATAGSQLRSLDLNADCAVLHTTGWPAGLTMLTSLSLSNDGGKLALSPALHSLRGLRHLDIYSLAGVLDEHNLPPGVTSLCWDEKQGFELPDELSALSSLRHLTVSCWNMDSSCFAALTGVSSLRHLKLDDAVLPDSLSQLTWLRSLHLEAMERLEGVLPGLEGALPALQQLTALALGFVPLWRPGLLAALDALPRLQRLFVGCAWDGYGDGRPGSSSTLPPADLPAPPFLGRLTLLGLDTDLLLRSPHLLAAASQLQHLWLLGQGQRRYGYARPWRALMKQVRQLPQLRSISLRPTLNWQGYVPPDLTWNQLDDLLALQRMRPGFQFHDWPFESDGMSLDELWQPFFDD